MRVAAVAAFGLCLLSSRSVAGVGVFRRAYPSKYEQPTPSPSYPPASYEPPKYEVPDYEPPKYETVTPYESPQYETSKYETVKYDAPKYETAKYDAPKYETAKYEPPKYDAPKYEAPKPVPIKSCPEGYLTEGEQCVGTQILPLLKKCPAGYELIGERCAVFGNPIVQCPEGYKRTNEGCINVVISPPIEICPVDSIPLTSGWCKVVEPQEPYCPHGYENSHHECVIQVDGYEKCPDGFQKMGDKCIRNHPSYPVCPPGTVLDSNTEKCERITYAEPVCPPGFESGAVGSCERQVPPHPAPCPAGYEPSPADSRKCGRIEKFPATPVCPVDMYLLADKKICQKEVPVPSYCPSGYSSSKFYDADACVKVAPRLNKCSEGYDRHTEGSSVVCRKPFYHPKTPVCQAGYELVGEKCKAIEVNKPSFHCPQGYQEENNGNRCVSRRHVPRRFTCPDGFDLMAVKIGANGQKYVERYVADLHSSLRAQCVRYISEDCSIKTYKEECTPDIPLPELPSKDLYGYSAYRKSINCQKIEVIIPKTCEKEEVVEPTSRCPEWTIESGKDCVVEESIEKLPVCPHGQHMDTKGDCFKIVASPVAWECPAGTEPCPSGKHRCVVYEDVPLQHYCPDAYPEYETSSDVCVQRAERIHPPAKVVSAPIKLVCDRGILKGEYCYDAELVSRHRECPPHAHLSYVVVEYENQEVCIQTVEAVPAAQVVESKPCEYSCPPGTVPTDDKKRCIEITERRVFICPPGSVPSGNSNVGYSSGYDHYTGESDPLCVKSAPLVRPPTKVSKIPADFHCPDGFSSEKAHGKLTCVLKDVCPVVASCPGDFTACDIVGMEGRCVKYTDCVFYCPPGTEKAAEGCVKRRYVAPIVTYAPTY